jgi:hypothetical protein
MQAENSKTKLPPLKVTLCAAFMFLLSGIVFGQNSVLTLDRADIRFQPVFSNGGIAGYNLFVCKKPGVESVMVTEPAGLYALRSTEWNSVNGSERRELSGVVLHDLHSRYSILSSTPVQDSQFGRAFYLFIPLKVVYGRPSVSAGPVLLYMENGVQINIRTFDHKYADPNRGRYRNNLFLLDVSLVSSRLAPDEWPVPASAGTVDEDLTALRNELRVIQIQSEFLEQSSGDELREFLHRTFFYKDIKKQK